LSEQSAPEKTAPKYPVSEHFKVLDGYDIYRSNNLIVALVAVEALSKLRPIRPQRLRVLHGRNLDHCP
jgi:hypothetical protein